MRGCLAASCLAPLREEAAKFRWEIIENRRLLRAFPTLQLLQPSTSASAPRRRPPLQQQQQLHAPRHATPGATPTLTRSLTPPHGPWPAPWHGNPMTSPARGQRLDKIRNTGPAQPGPAQPIREATQQHRPPHRKIKSHIPEQLHLETKDKNIFFTGSFSHLFQNAQKALKRVFK